MSLPSPTLYSPLYKTTSKGAEQQWNIRVVPVVQFTDGVADDGSGLADIVTTHGQVDGKPQTATVRIAKGKNLGKKNATTAFEQAISQAESKWKKQLDKGYSEQRGGAAMDLKPMLAQKYEDHADKVTYPAYVQPKLDGVRAIAVRSADGVKLYSRQGKEHKGLAHIRDALLVAMRPGEVWDGELYNHALPFQVLISLVKKNQAASREVQYHVYDVLADRSFTERHCALDIFVDGLSDRQEVVGGDCLRRVATMQVENQKEVELYHAKFVELGYEGAMLRWGDEPYKAGYRSKHLLKLKSFDDGEFEIVDVVPGVGKEADKATFVCRTDIGNIFNCRPRGEDQLRADYLTNKSNYVGLMLTVQHFGWTTTDKPVPRFPVGLRIRNEE